MLAGASNFTISGSARLYEIHGNAVINNLTDTDELKKIQSIVNLPRAQASQKDYRTRKKSGPCFPGTREALLREMMEWTTELSEARIYVLSGLAGIGKSTVAYTVATQADELGLLGASFFFSRDEDDRNNAKRFFCTIAYQLCVYNEIFAKAIVDVLLTERGSAATTKDPQEQLRVLILDPLRSIIQSHSRPILIIVDALDECNEDEHVVVMGLSQLVRQLPSFKVILTTRPQPLIDYLFGNHDGHKLFRLQDIEDKVVDGDIRLYLSHSFSQEQVRMRLLSPNEEWCASAEDIESLVKAAGRLFIIASTAVLYVLNKTLNDPGVRMKKLLSEIAQNRTPFYALNHFYSVIVHSVIHVDDDDDDIVDRYQSIIGSIVVVQTPLPVATVASLIGEESKKIRAMLRNLQSVVSLGSDDVPRIYHKSFTDYITDQARCKDPRLVIDPRIHHTQIAIRCFEIMAKHLKRNILDLGDPARFMNNEDGLKEDGITEERLQENIPHQLRYACRYWANHLEIANIEDEALMNGLEMFTDERLLYWLEVLSLIGKLDSAHRAIGIALTLLKSRSSDLHQLLTDALRFIGKFYELIKQSALHIYYSALPFIPTNSVFYHRYIKDAVPNICSIEGGPDKWDALVASMSHGERVDIVKFSLVSALFISCSQGKAKVWDAATGTPISTFPGHKFAVASDFSTVASAKDKTVSFYNVNGSARSTMFTTSSTIEKLILSSETNRVAAALSDRTVWLWDCGDAKLPIDRFDGVGFLLRFSPSGTKLAYSSANGITLRDGISGKFIADLRCASSHKFKFSGDGSRIVSLSYDHSLTLWNSMNGGLIAVARNVGEHALAISADGSLLATADLVTVRLWSETRNHLTKIEVLGVRCPVTMAFSLDKKLVIATDSDIMLYNVETHTFIHSDTFSHRIGITSVDFSPDCSRLAIGDYDGNVILWDIRSLEASTLPTKGQNATAITALTLSQSCSQLACGFYDGTVELWGTSPTATRRIDPLHSKMQAIFTRIFRQSRHTKSVQALGFDPDGRLFASGSNDGTVKLWSGGDGALCGTLKVPRKLQAVALSNSVLVVGWDRSVTLWNLDTLSPIRTFDYEASKVSIAQNSTLIAIFHRSIYSRVTFLDVVDRTTTATFDVPYSLNIHTMTFLPANSQLVVQSDQGVFISLNLISYTTEDSMLEHLVQLPNIPLWHNVPIWHCQDKNSEQHYFTALFSQHKRPAPVLWIPREIPVAVWSQGSSMIALGCEDGRVILVRLPTSHVS